MKGIVNTNLNLRIGAPSVNAPNPSYFKPGEEIKIVYTVVGDSYKQNDTWYKLANGGYVWSGGVEGIHTIIAPAYIFQKKYDYNSLVQKIPDKYKKTKGKGIKVAIIDSGINDKHPDLKINTNHIYDCSESEFGHLDPIGHGTHVAGLIGASRTEEFGITGVAPLSELFIFKARHEQRKFQQKYVVDSINQAISNGVNIINLSFKLSYYDNVKAAVERAISKKCIVVAAAGDDDNLTYKTFNRPAYFDHVISIGALDLDFFRNNSKPYNKKLCFILPKKLYYSTSIREKNDFEQLEGSSMATGIFSGVIALLLSKNKLLNNAALIKEIKKYAFNLSQYEDENELKIYKI